MERKLIKIHRGTRDDIADLKTTRALPTERLPHLDPFLFLNHHGPQVYPPGNHGLPFGPHPHRGFETLTVILDGDILHADSAGHESVIRGGGVQWMTAGSGLIHSETSSRDFRKAGGPLEILQLWINLPAKLKLTEPRYVGLQREEVPRVTGAGYEVQVISGSFRGTPGSIKSLTGIEMSTVFLEAGASLTLQAPEGRRVFFYVVRGEVRIGDEEVRGFELAEFSAEGEDITLRALSKTVVFFGHGEVIGEPVVSYGPFVMNTEQEIRQAIRDYQSGRFR